MPVGVRKHLLPPLVLLLLCSFLVLGVVHFELRPVGDALVSIERRGSISGMAAPIEKAAIAVFETKLFWAELLLSIAAVTASPTKHE